MVLLSFYYIKRLLYDLFRFMFNFSVLEPVHGYINHENRTTLTKKCCVMSILESVLIHRVVRRRHHAKSLLAATQETQETCALEFEFEGYRSIERVHINHTHIS